MSEVDHVSVDYMVQDPTIFSPFVTVVLMVATVALIAWFMRGILATTVNSREVQEARLQEAYDQQAADSAQYNKPENA